MAVRARDIGDAPRVDEQRLVAFAVALAAAVVGIDGTAARLGSASLELSNSRTLEQCGTAAWIRCDAAPAV